MPEALIDATRALRHLIDGRDLTRAEIRGLFGALMDGELGEAQTAALLVALAAKGETAEEIAGAAEAMRRRFLPVEHRVEGVVDTCGTGGDRSGTFNISTAAALVAAGAGVPVAKHGNRSVSSRSGSADVLQALGVSPESEPEEATRALEEIGICFLFAPLFHPAMRRVVPVRQALGVRTIFNILGPLTNPAGARRQVLGVYARHLVPTLAAVLRELGSEHALVVHGADGLDELTITGATYVSEIREGRLESRSVTPAELGVASSAPGDLRGGTPERNAELLEEVLEGAPGPLTEVTVLNAGAAIYVGGRAGSLRDGVLIARQAIAGGSAKRKLAELRRFSSRGADEAP